MPDHEKAAGLGSDGGKGNGARRDAHVEGNNSIGWEHEQAN